MALFFFYMTPCTYFTSARPLLLLVFTEIASDEVLLACSRHLSRSLHHNRC